jgi:hypothetical protein
MERKISTLMSVLSEQSTSQAQIARVLTGSSNEVLKDLSEFRKEHTDANIKLTDSINKLQKDLCSVEALIKESEEISKKVLCSSAMTYALLACHVRGNYTSQNFKEEVEKFLSANLSSMPDVQREDIVDFCVSQMESMSFPTPSKVEAQSTQAKVSPETPGELGKGPAKK